MIREERVMHELKTHVEPFKEVWAGNKTAEIRKADRDFQIGDTLRLKEFKHRKGEFTGRYLDFEITNITWLNRWVPIATSDAYVMLSMRPK